MDIKLDVESYQTVLHLPCSSKLIEKVIHNHIQIPYKGTWSLFIYKSGFTSNLPVIKMSYVNCIVSAAWGGVIAWFAMARNERIIQRRNYLK